MMQSKKDIIFLQSDASFSQKNKFANLTVYDTYENRFFNTHLFDIKNSTLAEYYALILSICSISDNVSSCFTIMFPLLQTSFKSVKL